MRKFLAAVLAVFLAGLAGSALAQFPPGGPLPWPPVLPPAGPPPMGAPVIGQDPAFGPICGGPLGPGPCDDVNRFLRVQYEHSRIQVPFLHMHPAAGPICNGPLGPGPCEMIRQWHALRVVASQQFQLPTWKAAGVCMGPLGPGPCDVIQAYLMQAGIGFDAQQVNLRQPQVLQQTGPNGEPMCKGPAGEIPCSLLAQVGLDMVTGTPPAPGSFTLPPGVTDAQKTAQECARRVGLDMRAFSACAGQKIVLPRNQQEILDCAVTSRDSAAFAACAAPKFGYAMSNDQQKVAGCAIKSKGGEQGFRSCVGGEFASKVLSEDERAILSCAADSTDAVKFGECAAGRFMGRTEKAVLDCVMKTSDATTFATCAAPHAGLKMSNDQRILAKCAMQTKGEASAFASCAGAAFAGNNLGENERKVLGCAANSGGDYSKFAGCSAESLFGGKLSDEQRIAVKCAAQSQGDPTGFATCAGANMFGMQLNPEQQIAVQCVVGTGGNPPAAAGCMASRLTARELTKCLTNGVGGKKGCFGDNNDLVGKNGFVGRTMGQIAGGPNSLINNPGQIWGGDNSFVRNPGQIFGGPNSFVRNPGQIWGGPNSVFNNPGQLLPKPKPLQVGSIGGKRICIPWC